MHNNYQNVLRCLDILSIALAVGLAMEDGPRRNGNVGRGDTSESGEDSEGGDEEREEEKKKEEEKNVEDRALLDEKEDSLCRDEEQKEEKGKVKDEKMGLGLLSETKRSPEPEDEKMDELSEERVFLDEKEDRLCRDEGQKEEENGKEEENVEDENMELRLLSETKLQGESMELVSETELKKVMKLSSDPHARPTRCRPPRPAKNHRVFARDSDSDSSDGNIEAGKSQPPGPERYHHVFVSDSESDSSDGNSKARKIHPPRLESYNHVLWSDSESDASDGNRKPEKTTNQMDTEESVSESEASDGIGKAEKTDKEKYIEEKVESYLPDKVEMKMKLKADIKSLLQDQLVKEGNLKTMAMGKYDFDKLNRSKHVRKQSEYPDSKPNFDNTAYFLQAPEQLNTVAVLTVNTQNSQARGLHSNTQRELEAEGAGRDAGVQVPGIRTHNATAPSHTPYEHRGLHSNTERELESAAAARDAHLPAAGSSSQTAAPQSSYPGKEGLHSNTERELQAAAAAVDANIPFAGRYAPEAASPEPQESGQKGSGLHSNSQRELVAAASARESGLSMDGPFVRSVAPPSSSSSSSSSGRKGSGLHSNTERELVAAAAAREVGISFDGPFARSPDAGTSRPGSSVIHSNTERELEAAAAGRHSLRPAEQSEPPKDSQGAARDEPHFRHGRKLSQKDLIGTSIAAALRLNPAHWMGTGHSISTRRNEHAEAEQPQHRRERKHSQRELVGISYAAKTFQWSANISHPPGSSSSANNLYRPPQGRQQRKMSQNDLLGLAHSAVRDRLLSERAAETSDAPQPSPLSHKYHSGGPPHTSRGQRHPPPNDDGSGSSSANDHRPAQQQTGTQMHQSHLASSTGTHTSSNAPPHHDSTSSSTGTHTHTSSSAAPHHDSPSRDSPRKQHSESQYPAHEDSSGSSGHRGADPRSTAQRDLNHAHRYRPYETQAHSGKAPNEEEEKFDSSRDHIYGHPPCGPSSGYHAQWVGSSAPDPDPGDSDDGDEEGSSEAIPEDDSDDFPRPPFDDDDSNSQPPRDDDMHVDDYDLPPPDEGDYDRMPQNYTHHLIYPPVDQYFRTPPRALPMLPFRPLPPPPPAGDYTASVEVGTRVGQPYLRVRQPGDRLLFRRPRCGLNVVSAMRRDKSLPVDRRKDNRIPRSPGRVDINFSPRTGDIILRHVRLPGQGAVEIWYPGLQTQDGDSLIRFKLDPWSYDSNTRTSSNLIIVKAKGYISFERMWIYMGRAINSVTKAEQRVLGVGAMDGRTVYAR